MQKNKAVLVILVALTMLLNACKKDEKVVEIPKTKGELLEYAMMVTGGTSPNQTAYFSGFEKLPTGAVGTSGAAELTGSGIMYAYNKNQYLITFGAPATLRKYGFDRIAALMIC